MISKMKPRALHPGRPDYLDDDILQMDPVSRAIVEDPTLPQGERKYLIMRRLVDLRAELSKHQKAHKELTETVDAIEDLSVWWKKGECELEKNEVSRLHKFFTASREDKVIRFTADILRIEQIFPADTVHPFVVSHNWAAAFDKAGDFEEGDWRLPFDHCAFEFRISGKNVIVLAMKQVDDPESLLRVTVFVECGRNGIWISPYAESDGPDYLLEMVSGQIRAISIALEAEAAVAEQVPAPPKLNKKRIAHGQLPIYSHHVVSLRRRSRTASGQATGATGGHKRLHFRRGHWRHYETHKTWIKWMLVGDPDLGFVDKEYRL